MIIRFFLLDLMAFVPDGEYLWILLPDARVATTLPEHHPVVVFGDTSKEIGWTDIKKKLKLKEDKFGEAWLLDSEDIIMDPEPLVGGYSIPTFPPGVTFPDGTNDKEFYWVPRMSDVHPGAAKIDGSCVVPIGTVPKKLVARMRLKASAIATFAFSKISEKIRPFRFCTSWNDCTSLPERALADVVLVTVEVPGNSVTFSSVRYTPGPPRPPKEIKGETGATIDILIANLSPNGTKAKDYRIGEHFARYYELGNSAVGPIPYLSPSNGVQPNESPHPLLEQMEEPLSLQDKLKYLVEVFKGPQNYNLPFSKWKSLLEWPPGGYNRPICTMAIFDPPE